MENFKQLNKIGTKILNISLIVSIVVLTFTALLIIADAGALDGDHMQDATGVNTSVINQVIRKGWGYAPGNSKFAIEDYPIDYGITFDELPFLVVNFANSRQVSEGVPDSLDDCTNTRKAIAAGINQGVNGFKPILRTTDTLGFPSGTYYCYTWMAIGRSDASYDGGVTGYWAQSGNNIYYSTGNVGIGTSNPAFALQVNSPGNSLHVGSGTSWIRAWTTGSPSLKFSDGQSGAKAGYITGMENANNENVLNLFGCNDGGTCTSSLAVHQGGNVGIGTNMPTEKLTLEGGNFLQTPGDPIHVSAIVDDANTVLDNPGGIHVKGKYAYVTSTLDHGVEILDVSDPANPTHVGAITDNATTELYLAQKIFVSGEYAYVTASWDDGVEILDISDPTNPTHVGAITDNAITELDGAVDIYVSGKYAYVTGYYDDGVEILDISDPTNPKHVGAITDNATTELDGAEDIFVAGKYAYVTANYDDGVEILDISDPANPTHVGAITDNATTALDGARSIYVSGKYAYVTSGEDDGVEILDISDPANPTHVAAITDDAVMELDHAFDIYVLGKYAYVTSYVDNGVEVLDISDPTNPTHVGAITDNGTTALDGAYHIYISGKYAYVTAADDDGVEILDISGIDAPAASIGSINANTIEVTENAQVANNLYVGNGLNVGIGGINSDGEISAGEYIQVDTITTAPPAADCDQASEAGLVKFDEINDLFYLCSGVSGWAAK